MKELLKQLIKEKIEQWDDPEIYAVSLFVYDDEDDPCKPTVTLGYNTENEVQENLDFASDEEEARWNYAFWLQNEELHFGVEDTAETVRQWIIESGLEYCQACGTAPEESEDKITKAFVELLVDIVKELHESGFISSVFGREIPVLIHELEYYPEIAEQNIRANGYELVREFVGFCGFFYQE